MATVERARVTVEPFNYADDEATTYIRVSPDVVDESGTIEVTIDNATEIITTDPDRVDEMLRLLGRRFRRVEGVGFAPDGTSHPATYFILEVPRRAGVIIGATGSTWDEMVSDIRDGRTVVVSAALSAEFASRLTAAAVPFAVMAAQSGDGEDVIDIDIFDLGR